MASKGLKLRNISRQAFRYYCTNPTSTAITADVPGLSEAVVTPVSKLVGPNVDPSKTGAYKVPEYFCYHNMSYHEAEVELLKYRLPQPSAEKPVPNDK